MSIVAPQAVRNSAVTRRAVLLGVLLVPLNVWWVITAELRWYVVLTLNPLFVTPVFQLFALTGVNAILRRMRPGAELRAGELVTVYVMLVISCTVATHDFIINLMSIMGWPAWFATKQNDWRHLMIPHLPRSLFVWDRQVLEGYFSGSSTLWSPRVMRAWAGPLALWAAFIFCIGWMMMCLTVIVRKAWMDDTRLSFPIIRLPLVLTGEQSHAAMFRSQGMWYGFAAAFLLQLINGLHLWFPNIPSMQVRASYLNLPGPPWSAAAPMSLAWYPFGIGLAFLIPVDVSFSIWFFYLFFKAEAVLGYRLGYGSVPDMPFVHEQEIGGWFAFGISLLIVYRRYFLGVFRRGLIQNRERDPGEPISYRAAVWGFVASAVFFVVFWCAAGMSVVWAGVALAAYVLISISITRVRAESGGQHNVWDPEPQNLMRLFDSSAIGPSTLSAGAVSHWFWRLNRCHPMPSMFESFKLAQEHRMRFRDLVWPMLVAFMLSTVAGMWACLHVFYGDGALAKVQGFGMWTGLESFSWLENALRNGFKAEMVRWSAVGGGATLVLALAALRTRFVWMPFHPLGFCMGAEMRWLWMPYLLGWLAKVVILKGGGLRLYRRALPFFLGLILGDYTAGAVWSLIGVIFHVPVLQIFH